jgi:hypothetical protein
MIQSDHGADRIRASEAMEYPPAFPGSVGLAPRNVTTLARIRFRRRAFRSRAEATAGTGRVIVGRPAFTTPGIMWPDTSRSRPGLKVRACLGRQQHCEFAKRSRLLFHVQLRGQLMVNGERGPPDRAPPFPRVARRMDYRGLEPVIAQAFCNAGISTSRRCRMHSRSSRRSVPSAAGSFHQAPLWTILRVEFPAAAALPRSDVPNR